MHMDRKTRKRENVTCKYCPIIVSTYYNRCSRLYTRTFRTRSCIGIGIRGSSSTLPTPPTADEDSVVIAISSTSGCKACLTPLLPVVVEPLTTFSFVLVLVMWEVVADVVAVLSLLIIPSFLFSNDDDDDDDDDDDVSVFVSTIIGCCCCCSLPPSIQTGAVPLFVVIAFRPVIVSAECPVDS